MRPRRIAAAAALAATLSLSALPTVARSDDGGGNPGDALLHRGDRYVPKPAGTREELKFWFGPYTVPPGWDANRFDLDLPLANGFITQIEPGMRRTQDLSEPSHQEAHIHHAHWFALDPGNQEDSYTDFVAGQGATEWIFGNGDEETKANFEERSAADPNGPIYGQFIGASGPQLMIYMLHNKTAQPLLTYIVLDVTFVHGTAAELAKVSKRPYHDVSGVLFGRTYDVKREPNGDGTYESAKDDPKGPIEWVSTLDGTIIGTGGHLHPGGTRVVVENYGSKENPCPDDGRGYGGTLLLTSDALFRRGLYTEDFQMEVTHPAFRAPIHKGDRIRISGTYENREHAWYDVMTHEGIYIDEAQAPQGRCKPKLINQPKPRAKKKKRQTKAKAKKGRQKASGRKNRASGKPRKRAKRRPAAPRRLDPTEGVPSRPWGHRPDVFCGVEFGGPACERPEQPRGRGLDTSLVTIANFLYLPGDQSLSGEMGAPARIKRGSSLTVLNADQEAGIRHTVTTCRWPCNGRYVANYPFPDGSWDSGTLGYDVVDGGSPNPIASTPKDLAVGKYAYFCRIHPWMRGAFEVVQ